MDVVALPKVVLHDHLDGGLRPATILELADASGYDRLPASEPTELADWFDQGRAGSLDRYLEAFSHTVAVMQTAPAIERVAYESLVDAAADGVVHLESRFAPSLLTGAGLSRLDVLAAAAAGFHRAETEVGATWGIIVDAMRHDSDSLAVAETAIAAVDLGIVGFDLAGPEVGFPASNHRAACELVLEAGLGLTIHAGEAAGPASIADALSVGAQRIGHGYRIVEDCRFVDGALVDAGPVARQVLEERIPLEVCPTSNVHTGGFPLAQHPVTALVEAGFKVTINPDNRLMSRTSASHELAALIDRLGWDAQQVSCVLANAADAAFLEGPRRWAVLERVTGASLD